VSVLTGTVLRFSSVSSPSRRKLCTFKSRGAAGAGWFTRLSGVHIGLARGRGGSDKSAQLSRAFGRGHLRATLHLPPISYPPFRLWVDQTRSSRHSPGAERAPRERFAVPWICHPARCAYSHRLKRPIPYKISHLSSEVNTNTSERGPTSLSLHPSRLFLV
jgi:hypothetical protein